MDWPESYPGFRARYLSGGASKQRSPQRLGHGWEPKVFWGSQEPGPDGFLREGTAQCLILMGVWCVSQDTTPHLRKRGCVSCRVGATQTQSNDVQSRCANARRTCPALVCTEQYKKRWKIANERVLPLDKKPPNGCQKLFYLPANPLITSGSAGSKGVPSGRKISWNHTGGSSVKGFTQDSQG